MKVNIEKARTKFFQNSSLEMIYFEAIANALDAEADKIEIYIELDDFLLPETMKIQISDNGLGFTNDRFDKFKTLLEVEDIEHKGLGRLVYLNYFDHVHVRSIFENMQREFIFHDNWDEKSNLIDLEENRENETVLNFYDFNNKQIKTYDYLVPDSLKNRIIFHFLPRFYSMQALRKNLIIKIILNTKKPDELHGFISSKAIITLNDLPKLKEFKIENLYTIESKMSLHYSIESSIKPVTLITAIAVDSRTISLDIIPKESMPVGHETVFILTSEYFNGKSDNTRQGFNLPSEKLIEIKTIFKNAIRIVLREKLPIIQELNDKVIKNYSEKYPHLSGYFIDDSIGLIDKNSYIETAQRNFFSDQRVVLEATDLDEAKYTKSIELSARTLLEYILYRNKIIDKLKNLNLSHNESEIHNLILPRYKQFQADSIIDDIYSNNAWILDDKYMTYSTILSEKDMKCLLEAINVKDFSNKNGKRPDIAIVFSKDPQKNNGVDVVIVELKKMGIGLAKNLEAIMQLKERARNLLNHYPEKIQRIWFYAVVEFNHDVIWALEEDKFIELYSKDKCYYQEHASMPNFETKKRIPVGIFVLSYKALFEDAESRNATFLKILKESVRKIKECGDEQAN